ncbi:MULTISPECIES: hypothetical protein [unclassified Streptomyces]|uniref:hypothetical protein n=1 Tax=unclassified Streptomyces TaxID=2593676 RepID=UPI002E77C5CD|nr:hypothetical protein [Streptomyces sp. JV185]MEE1767143.1 hypothetical protein [Streptomyces sp. JV185]
MSRPPALALRRPPEARPRRIRHGVAQGEEVEVLGAQRGPGVVSLLEKVATAREAAERETHARVAHLLYPERTQGVDGLLVVDPELKSSRLHWLVTGPVQASPTSVGGEVEKLGFLLGLGADTLDMSSLPAERRRYLAQIGRRLTAGASRSPPGT